MFFQNPPLVAHSHKYLSIKCIAFRTNTMRDSIIVGLCNSLTSLYAGVVVFLILGFLAKKSGGVEIDQVVKGNLELNSGSFVQRQKRIAIYHVKKFVKDSQF